MINSVSGSVETPFGVSTPESQATFESAILKAKAQELTPEEEEFMIEGIVTVGSQLLLAPLSNDILSESMSDE